MRLNWVMVHALTWNKLHTDGTITTGEVCVIPLSQMLNLGKETRWSEVCSESELELNLLHGVLS